MDWSVKGNINNICNISSESICEESACTGTMYKYSNKSLRFESVACSIQITRCQSLVKYSAPFTARERIQVVLRATHVVVGLAGDYCVKCSSIDSTELSWATYVVADGICSVGGEQGLADARTGMDIVISASVLKKRVRRCARCLVLRTVRSLTRLHRS